MGQQTYKSDVVIVGGGIAGITSTIELLDRGLSLIPPKSALWVDCYGKRIGPRPMVTDLDTTDLLSSPFYVKLWGLIDHLRLFSANATKNPILL